MGYLGKAVLYTALAAFANGAAAGAADIEALKVGDMRKLAVHAEPTAVPEAAFGHLDGGEFRMADFQGKWLLVNFWATWCAPCRKEMPSLDRLQADLGGPSFEVLTIATGRNAPEAMRRFFEETQVTHLPLYIDPRNALAAPMGVMGLPVTVLIDPDGREAARLIGEAEWDSPEARAILAAFMAGG